MSNLSTNDLTLSGEIGHKNVLFRHQQNVRFHHSLWFVETKLVARLDIFMSNLNTGFRCYFCYNALSERKVDRGRSRDRARDWESFEFLLSDIELVHTEVFTPDAINNVIFEQPREHQFKCFYNIEDKEMVIETAVFNVEGEDEDLGVREWSETARNG